MFIDKLRTKGFTMFRREFNIMAAKTFVIHEKAYEASQEGQDLVFPELKKLKGEERMERIRKGLHVERDEIVLPQRWPYDNVVLELDDMSYWVGTPSMPVRAEGEHGFVVVPFAKGTLDQYPDGVDIAPMFYIVLNDDHRVIDAGAFAEGHDWMKEDQQAVMTIWTAFIFISYKFLSFLSCRNIRVVPVRPDARAQRQRAKKKKAPWATYHVLELSQDYLKRHGKQDKKGLWTNRVHLCRGHIKRYTPERPHVSGFVGNIWCPPHVRGDKKKGVVVKDYELKEGEDS